MAGKIITVASALLALSLAAIVPIVENDVFNHPPAELAQQDVTSTIASASTTILAPATIKSATLVIVEGSTTVMPTIVQPTMVEPTFVEPIDDIAPHTVEVPVQTTMIHDPRPVCGRMGRDLVDACVRHVNKRYCHEDDARCLCKKSRAQHTCFNTCPFDERVPSIQMQENKFCTMAYVEPGPNGHQLNPKYTTTRFEYKTVTLKHKIIVHTPVATEIVYKTDAGVVTIWRGPAGHTHVPSIVRTHVEGDVVFKTLNARPTNAAAVLKVPGLAAVAGGAIGLMAAAM